MYYIRGFWFLPFCEGVYESVKSVFCCSRNSKSALLIALPGLFSCEPRSHTSSHTSLVPEGSFPLPAAPEASTNHQRPAADSWRPQKISSRPTHQRSDPPTGTRPRPAGTADRRIPKWLKLPGTLTLTVIERVKGQRSRSRVRAWICCTNQMWFRITQQSRLNACFP